MWNKDEIRGKGDQIKGNVEKKLGDLNGDEDLRDRGEADEAAGNVEEGAGKARRKVGEAIKDVGDKLGH